MYDNITFVIPETCDDAGQNPLVICIPKKVECGWQPNHLLTDETMYNCALPCPQLDKKWYMPFEPGDKIQLQFLFFDTTNDKTAPTTDPETMFTISTFSTDGLLDITTKISRSMAAFQDGVPYQIIEIDTTGIDQCWSASFTYGGKTINTQEFQPIDGCIDTFIIKSEANKKDCLGYYYGVPDFYAGDEIEYDNSLRFYGGIKSTDFSVELTEVGNKRNAVLRDEYTLYLKGLIPEFAKVMIARQMLLNGLLWIDGIEYEHEGFSVSNDVTIGSMWYMRVKGLFRECDNKVKCN